MSQHDDELLTNPQSAEITPPQEERKSKRTIRKISWVAIGLFLVYLIYSVADIFLSPDRGIRQTHLVPSDAAFIIQSSNPVEDWKAFSDSPAWKCLKGATSFGEVTAHVDKLDSVVQNNKTLLSLVGKRDLLISIHKTKSNDWDCLMILDMQKVSKMNLLKDQIENILGLTGYSVTQRKYDGITILEMHNPKERDVLSLAFVENHLVASYTSRLVTSAIDARKNPKIGTDNNYMEAEKLVAGKGLARFFINYAYLPQFISIYLGENNEYIDWFSHSMDYAGLYFNMNKEKVEMEGYTLLKDSADSYITALLNSGKHKMKAHEILSARTSFYTNVGFGSPLTFVKELENVLLSTDKASYDNYVSSRKKIERLFGISLEENFLSWMSGEFAIAQLEPSLLGRDPELVLAIRAKNIKDVCKNMDIIEKQVRKRTPIKVKMVEYKGFEINYIEMKGFFRLFFGGLFDKFEKPYYTYLGDYIVLSNKASSLLSFIEDYEQKNLLKDDAGFKKSLSSFDSNSTLFVYADMHRFYPQLQRALNRTTWADLEKNKEIFYSFPHWGMQVLGNRQSASLHYVMNYKPYEPAQEMFVSEPDADDKAMNEDAESKRELMNELKRFYVEKFEGNVLREFYPEGALKSETEIREGRRHGRHREYYENGKLKVRGKYAANQPKGTWKYYTEEGTFERKEKF